MPVPPLNVFIGYAPKDEVLRGELAVFLEPFRRQGIISDWHKQEILPGDNIDQAVNERIRGAHIIILLVSSDFLASELCNGQEMTRTLESQSAGEVGIVPTIIRDCCWDATPFAGLQALPKGGRPVTSWRDRDQAWKDVVLGVRAVIDKLTKLPGKAEPRYDTDLTKILSLQLENAYARKRSLLQAGHSSEIVDGEILEIRRRLRKGGQLRAGDSLGNGRYLLVEPVGRGGFGSVWKAEDRLQNEIVAIKVLHTHLAGDKERVDRFFRGARIMAKMAHEAIVRVLNGRGEDDGLYYFVMDFIFGCNLGEAVINEKISKDHVIPIVLRVGEALAFAHSKRLVHRDIKPENILLDIWNVPYLTDFDLVSGPDTTGGTKSGVMGTFRFAAPEVLDRPQDADASADVFSLGMTTLFGLYGKKLPYEGISNTDLIIDELSCAESIKIVLKKSLRINRNARFQNAKEFCDALSNATESITTAAAPSFGISALSVITAPFLLTRSAAPAHANAPEAQEGNSDETTSQDRDQHPTEATSSCINDPYIDSVFNDRYKIKKVIGEGGMGIVYLALDTKSDTTILREVAVKILRSDLARERDNLNRFRREAKAASMVGNPHIVEVLDFGDLPDGSTFFVMEYLSGNTLSDLINAEKFLSDEQTCDIAIQIADGLAAAHKCGIIHRDLKPDNIVLANNNPNTEFVKIVDFGIVKFANSEASKLTRIGTILGTPHYMSPEQVSDGELDHRTDIYSLGVVLYEMKTGRLPFDANSIMAIALKHVQEKPIPVRELAPHCSPGLEAVILKCLSKEPEARYQTMSDLAVDLDSVRSEAAVSSTLGPVVDTDEVSAPSDPAEVPIYIQRVTSFLGRRSSIYVAIGVLTIALTFIIVAIINKLAGSRTGPVPIDTPTVPKPATSSPVVAPTQSGTASPTASEPPVPPTPSSSSNPVCQEPGLICVELSVTPKKAEAKAKIGNGDSFDLPATIEVKNNKVVTVKIQAKGYQPEIVHLDGKKPRWSVPLKRWGSEDGDVPPPPPTTSEPQVPPPPIHEPDE